MQATTGEAVVDVEVAFPAHSQASELRRTPEALSALRLRLDEERRLAPCQVGIGVKVAAPAKR